MTSVDMRHSIRGLSDQTILYYKLIYSLSNVDIKPAGVAIMTRSKIALELP